jgi:hypothetical protein
VGNLAVECGIILRGGIMFVVHVDILGGACYVGIILFCGGIML